MKKWEEKHPQKPMERSKFFYGSYLSELLQGLRTMDVPRAP